MDKLILYRHLRNIPGWRTHKKIVVFESDDWGSIRMPSLEAFAKLEKSGIDLRSFDAEKYNLYDTLASGDDLSLLFEVLSGHRDSTGKHPVFTPVAIMANPDFNKIRESDFSRYYYEPFTETLKRIPGCENSFNLWKEGIRKRLFVPQFHGREHLNISAWMKSLQMRDKQALLAFDEGMWGFVPDQKIFPQTDYQAAFLVNDSKEIEFHKEIITEGLDLFERLLGYRATYFVAPNGPFNNSLNPTLAASGIKLRTTSKVQKESIGNGKTRNVVHWLGQKNQGITYITRNCFFEPSPHTEDWTDSCLRDIEVAFRWNKPAIISTHRVNFIGSHNAGNRGKTLTSLNHLLKEIIMRWPAVMFLTTEELGNLIEK